MNQLPLPLHPARFFRSRIMAGFECGLVHRGRHDLLITTGHTADDRLVDHFRIVRNHGLLTIRDGIVPGHHALARLAAARGGRSSDLGSLPLSPQSGSGALCSHRVRSGTCGEWK